MTRAERAPRYSAAVVFKTRPSAAEVDVDNLAATALDRPRFDPPSAQFDPRVQAPERPAAVAAPLSATAAIAHKPLAFSASRTDVLALALIGALSVATGALFGAWLFGG
jgi:hypothetical protein